MLLERVLTESGVDRTPQPPAASYAGELYTSLVENLLAAIARAGRMLHLDADVVTWVLAGAVALLLAVAGWRIARALRSRRAAPETGERTIAQELPAAERDAAAWWTELERCLAEERIEAALRAAWWWLARSVSGERAAADWTSRDLLVHSGRNDLREPLRRLDALLYGPRRPQAGDIRQWVEGVAK